MNYLCRLSISEWGPFYAEFEIEYGPSRCVIIDVHVTYLKDSDNVYFTNLLGREAFGKWVKDLDRLALEYVLDNEEELYLQLIEDTDYWDDYYYDYDYDA